MTDNNDEHEDRDVEQPAPSMPAPTPDAFAAVFDLIALAADPRAFKSRLRGLHEALTAADEAQKRLVAAQTEFEIYRTKTIADLEEQAAALQKRRVAVHATEMDLQIRENAVAERHREIMNQDTFLKRRAAAIAQMDWPSPLQDPPSWPQLVAELAGAAHNPSPDADESEMESSTNRIEGAPQYLDVRQTKFRKAPRSSSRRMQPEI